MIPFLKKYWWAIVLVALVGWSAALVYFTISPPETALQREVKIQAGFLEPKQAKDLAEAEGLLNTVNQYVRQLPEDAMRYNFIMGLKRSIGNGVFTEDAKKNAEKEHGGMKWQDIESDWLGQTASVLGLGEENRPKDLKEAAAKLDDEKRRIEKENNEGFNKTLGQLLDDLKNNRNRSGLLDDINRFLALDETGGADKVKGVMGIAKERLILRGTPAIPALAAILEQAPSSDQGARVYEVILNIIAGTRLTSLDPADMPKQVAQLRHDFGEKPDAKAIQSIKEWLNSPANLELLGK